MNKIVCAYTESGLTQLTRDALQNYNVEYHLMQTDTDYSQLMARLWHQGETFINVEHDINPWPGALDSLVTCDNIWCAYEYRINSGFIAGIGCCKFKADLIAQMPDLVDEVNEIEDRVHPKGHWCTFDIRLQTRLHAAGYTKCIHWPRVEHVNPWQSHRCY